MTFVDDKPLSPLLRNNMANGEWEQKRRRSHRNAVAQKDDHSFGQTDRQSVSHSVVVGKGVGEPRRLEHIALA